MYNIIIGFKVNCVYNIIGFKANCVYNMIRGFKDYLHKLKKTSTQKIL